MDSNQGTAFSHQKDYKQPQGTVDTNKVKSCLQNAVDFETVAASYSYSALNPESGP